MAGSGATLTKHGWEYSRKYPNNTQQRPSKTLCQLAPLPMPFSFFFSYKVFFSFLLTTFYTSSSYSCKLVLITHYFICLVSNFIYESSLFIFLHTSLPLPSFSSSLVFTFSLFLLSFFLSFSFSPPHSHLHPSSTFLPIFCFSSLFLPCTIVRPLFSTIFLSHTSPLPPSLGERS